MSFVIEKGIPLPPVKGNPDAFYVLLQRMEIGDSVVIPYPKSKSGIYSAAKNANRAIATRMVSKTHMRVWRTA